MYISQGHCAFAAAHPQSAVNCQRHRRGEEPNTTRLEGREEQREGGNKKDGEEGKKSTEDGSGTQRERWHVCTFLSKNARTSSPRELTFREGGCRNRKVVLGWSLGSKLRNGTPVLAQLCHQLFQFRLVII